MAKLKTVVRAAAAALAVAVSLPAAAEQAEPPPEAVEAARRGRELFEAGRYREARIELEEAYRLFPAPPLLHNIGRCREEMGEWCEAARAYVDFLREGSPSGEVRAEVVRSIAELEERCEQAGGPGARDAGGAGRPEGEQAAVGAGGEQGSDIGTSARLFGGGPGERSTATTDIWGGVLMGTGAAAALTGMVLWLYAESVWDCVLPDPAACSQDAEDAIGGHVRAGDAMLYSGIVVAAGGLAVLLLGRLLPRRAAVDLSFRLGLPGAFALAWR